jgi:hypothetical protein
VLEACRSLPSSLLVIEHIVDHSQLQIQAVVLQALGMKANEVTLLFLMISQQYIACVLFCLGMDIT